MGDLLASLDGASLASLDDGKDSGYPTRSEQDSPRAAYTQRPLLPLFDGVALPATWSRLGDVLERAFAELWRAHGVAERHVPRCWISLHCGRIYVNAGGFEVLCAAVVGRPTDPDLVEPPEGLLPRFQEWKERRRAAGCRRTFSERLRHAEEKAVPLLARAAGIDVAGLDTRELARGPLDRASWIELLIPWLGTRVLQIADPRRSDPPPVLVGLVREALRFEQRCAAELGRRFVKMGVCSEPRDIIYLTLEERAIALRQSIPELGARVAARRERVEAFARIDLPVQFSEKLTISLVQ
jgi:hypothetical protein